MEYFFKALHLRVGNNVFSEQELLHPGSCSVTWTSFKNLMKIPVDNWAWTSSSEESSVSASLFSDDRLSNESKASGRLRFFFQTF
ncbi:hypothetical protein TNCV_4938171 [Trichonephila clavipes]|nr:hypothetical protein TNCV_4938171 [Trichonephila clavipes]